MALREFIASYVVSMGDADRYGVHELVPAIARRRDDANPEELLPLCREVCVELLQAGHARVTMTPAGADRPDRTGYTKVSTEDAIALLGEEAPWLPPSNARPRYWLVATDAGRATYISDDVVSL